jgi:phospholipid/cholesterol/gamma-HCH transport system substrate-binding protein
MSTTARDRRRAIAFIAGGALLLASVLGLVSGVRLGRRDRTYFVTVPDSVSGLRAASTIEYKGVPVGVVKKIEFRGGSVEAVQVELAILRGVPIKVDTRARLRPQGITGLNMLELIGGTSNATDLPEHGDIPIQPSILAELESTVHDVAALARRLGATTATIDSEAAPAIADLRAALRALKDAARTFDATTAAVGSEALASGSAFRATASRVEEILSDPAWRSLGTEVAGGVEDARRAIERLDKAASEAEQVVQENRSSVRATIENLRRASGDARAATRELRESPSSLFRENKTAEKSIPDAPSDTRREP